MSDDRSWASPAGAAFVVVGLTMVVAVLVLAGLILGVTAVVWIVSAIFHASQTWTLLQTGVFALLIGGVLIVLGVLIEWTTEWWRTVS